MGRPSGARVLVVTEHLVRPSLRGDDRFAFDVVDGLVRLVGAKSLSVAVLDGHSADVSVAALRSFGVEVVAGPADWAGWLFSRWGSYSHVFVTRSALDSPVMAWLEDSQPSAAKVLCVDHISSRATRSRRAFVDLGESEGVELLAELSERHLLDALDGFDAALCAARNDADWMAGSTGRPAYLMAPRFVASPADLPFHMRVGVTVFASASYDVSAGSEDSALRSIDTVARLRAFLPGLAVAVVGDRLSPRLRRAAADVEARLVGEADAAACVAASRLAIISGRYGAGATGPLLAAIDARTPVLATSAVASAAGLNLMAEPWYSDTPASIHALGRQLLSDDATWTRYHDSIDRFARRHPATPAPQIGRPYDSGPLADAGPLADLQSLLIDLGVDAYPCPKASAYPTTATATTAAPDALCNHPQPPPLRPGGPPIGVADVDVSIDHPADAEARYRLWQLAHTPTPEILQAIAADALDTPTPPTVSIVLAIDSSEPAGLAQTIKSVKSQAYPHWQLFVAFDRESTSPEGQKVILEALRDGRVHEAPHAPTPPAGDYLCFADAGDVLQPHALAQIARWVKADPTLDVVYTDEDRLPARRSGAATDDDTRGDRVEAHVKPDWSPDLLMSTNYLGNLVAYRRSVVESLGGLREEMGEAKRYDLSLRVTEVTGRVGHIPEPLYSVRNRATTAPAAPSPALGPAAPAPDPAATALADALERRGTPGSVEPGTAPSTYRVRYQIPGSPKVSIIIPTHNGFDLLKACVESILERSTYRHYEIVILDNRSDDGDTLSYMAKAPLRVLRYPLPFNYARQMNLAAASCKADALVFLNNDTIVITPDWLEALLEHAMRPEVGAVGCRLYYPDGRVQHEGILSGTIGWAWNIDHQGYFARGDIIRNVSSVTGAATMVRPGVFGRVGGNDEDLRIAYNDVDLGERIRQAGYRIVYTPYAELYHCEGSTRGRWEHPDDEVRFERRWEPRTHVDPYYSPLFQRDRPFKLAV